MLNDTQFDDLPDEIQQHIMSFFQHSPKTMNRLARVSKRCNALVNTYSIPVNEMRLTALATHKHAVIHDEIERLIFQAIEANQPHLITNILNKYAKHKNFPHISTDTVLRVLSYCAQLKFYELAEYLFLSYKKFDYACLTIRLYNMDDIIRNINSTCQAQGFAKEETILSLVDFSLSLKLRFMASVPRTRDSYSTWYDMPQDAGFDLRQGENDSDSNYDELCRYFYIMQEALVNIDVTQVLEKLYQTMVQFLILKYELLPIKSELTSYTQHKAKPLKFARFIDHFLQYGSDSLCITSTAHRSTNELHTLNKSDINAKVKRLCLEAYQAKHRKPSIKCNLM